MNDLISLQGLFYNKIFRIPDYQRGYSWTLQQLKEFWSDIYNLLPDMDHYTGMVSLKELTKEKTNNWTKEQWLLENGYKAYHVVDGQQRLTTIIILINEIVNYYKNNKSGKSEGIYINKKSLDEITKEYLYIVDPESNEITKTYKFGYEVDNPSYEYFKHRILNEPNEGKIEETFYTMNLNNAKEFFYNEIDNLVKNGGFEELDNIFKKLTQRVKFNIYYIEDNFNVFIAFETMNNRGKPLSYLELLKNRLIYLSTLYKCKESVKSNLRDEINETWKTVYGYLGKNKERPLNDNEFLQNHWMIYFKYTRSNSITYNSFLLDDYFTQQNIFNDKVVEKYDENENITETRELQVYEEDIIETDTTEEKDEIDSLTIDKINKYVLSLKNLSSNWYYMYNPSEIENNDIKMYLERLYRLGYSNFKPLITVLLSRKDISDDKKIKTLKGIERFIFLHYRLNNYQGTYRNSFFYGLAHKLYFNEITIDEVIKEVNNIDFLSNNDVMRDRGVLDKFSKLFNSSNNGFYSWATLRYLLYEYERHLMYGKGTTRLLPSNIFKTDKRDTCSIEHVYPQTPTDKYWISMFKDYTDDEKFRLNGSLGNLLPLSKSINSSFQNIDFTSKVNGINRFDLDGVARGYKNGSYNEIEVSQNEAWDSNAILERGLKIVSFMEQEWKFHFQNKADKIKFLGLDFMIKNEDEYIEVYEPEESEETNISSTNDSKRNNKEIIIDSLDELLNITLDGITYGYGYYKDRGILVLKGTKLRTGIVAANEYMQNRVNKFRMNPKIKDDEFVEDEFYSSPSLAANVILGNNKNGWVNWCSSSGKTLDELVRK